MYLQEPILDVHEIDYSVGKLHDDLLKIIYYLDALLMDNMQRDFGAYTWLENGWRKGCFTLIKMAWVPSIKRLVHDKIVHEIGMTQ